MNIPKFDSRFQILPIKKIIKENEYANTYVFEYALGSKPGQFVMMWIPGVDEKPMSVAFDDGKEFWVTVCKVGPATKELFELKAGDKVGIRGPLGTYYSFKKGRHLALVAGGYGAAPMYYVAHEAVKKGYKVEFLIGARNKDLLLYAQKIVGLEGVNLHVATNDGSAGVEGFVTRLLEKVLQEQKIDEVFTCGPEIMMKIVGEIAEKFGVPARMSMEKHMKCGIGVCGQCALDDTGDLVCVKGPVMSWDYVKKLPEMGVYHRDAQGKKHYF
ncbi:dihydroorotate dehydrogenase electron transfer subunit [Candidatus Peregrinibacteria bacterium]|nr:dihydroorotate dehydrogenase electron transfer subunit [Candidatus Peregrinibacteria bacterium]